MHQEQVIQQVLAATKSTKLVADCVYSVDHPANKTTVPCTFAILALTYWLLPSSSSLLVLVFRL